MATFSVQMQAAFINAGKRIFDIDQALTAELDEAQNHDAKVASLKPEGCYLHFGDVWLNSFADYEGVLVEKLQDADGSPMLGLFVIPQAWGTDEIHTSAPPRALYLFQGDESKTFGDLCGAKGAALDEQSEAEIGQEDANKFISLVMNALLYLQEHPEAHGSAMEPSAQKSIDKARYDIRSTKAEVDEQLLLDAGYIEVTHVSAP
ncbi:hypothetical protein [Neptuniibacter sp. QD37_11]|uniref:hypothetical protein n=1 Tax=Neptuniibacter sp. QD37_11 TaxID=3398209 RepID=UPI0039F5265D